jgi:hypothetical protein
MGFGACTAGARLDAPRLNGTFLSFDWSALEVGLVETVFAHGAGFTATAEFLRAESVFTPDTLALGGTEFCETKDNTGDDVDDFIFGGRITWLELPLPEETLPNKVGVTGRAGD